MMEIIVNGSPVQVPEGSSILEACDHAGAFVPRLCAYPGLSCCSSAGLGGTECGLCVVGVADVGGAVGSDDAAGRDCGADADAGRAGVPLVLACRTAATDGAVVITDGAAITARRLASLSAVLGGHPHICLTCPQREGCARDSCTFGYPAEARCCGEFGRCELGRLVKYLDPGGTLPGGPTTVDRSAVVEGRIRREPGLCVGCGRCVVVCAHADCAGRALEIPAGGAARSKKSNLRESGCTFCGSCVLVCPAGALTAPGPEGAAWLERRREENGLLPPVLPPERWNRTDSEIPVELGGVPGVFQLLDVYGNLLYIAGVPDLGRGLAVAIEEHQEAVLFKTEEDPFYTQRESEYLTRYAQQHGHLPPGNDMRDDLFQDELSGDTDDF